MQILRSYPNRVEADLARIALEGVGIPALVVGLGVGWEGGMAGVQLLVPEDRIEEARKVLEAQ
jgi:Putative prokaryotic signal transducing protein